ncbi:unnamed protein product, partial [Rotaria sp. Silwood1]
MNQTSVLTLLHLCLSKEQRLNHDINIILFECQRLVRRHCRHSNLQNKLIITLFTLVDNSAEINRPRLGYPMYIGVLDGTHVSVKPPLGDCYEIEWNIPQTVHKKPSYNISTTDDID